MAAAARADAAALRNPWPSKRSPRSATNKSPSRRLRLSVETPVNSASSPLARPPSAAAASASRIICLFPLHQRRARLFLVGKMGALAGDLLVVLVSLAGNEDHVRGIGVRDHLAMARARS